MKLDVVFRGTYGVLAGTSQLTVNLPEAATVNDLIKTLSQKFKEAPLDREQTLIAVDEVMRSRDYSLNDGERVVIFHLMAGG